jgi:hypothetical protein
MSNVVLVASVVMIVLLLLDSVFLRTLSCRRCHVFRLLGVKRKTQRRAIEVQRFQIATVERWTSHFLSQGPREVTTCRPPRRTI